MQHEVEVSNSEKFVRHVKLLAGLQPLLERVQVIVGSVFSVLWSHLSVVGYSYFPVPGLFTRRVAGMDAEGFPNL